MFDDIRALEVMVCPGVAEGLGGRAVVSFRLETGHSPDAELPGAAATGKGAAGRPARS
jgi:hypothetical protein